MKKKNNNLTPFIFLLVFIVLCMILVNIQGAKVNEITIDEFTKYLNNSEITELEIITKVRSENYEVTGKIKDIFIDSKIPLDLRDNYPLLVDADDNILWIPNIKKSKYNVKKDEFYDIILTSHKEGEKLNEEKE